MIRIRIIRNIIISMIIRPEHVVKVEGSKKVFITLLWHPVELSQKSLHLKVLESYGILHTRLNFPKKASIWKLLESYGIPHTRLNFPRKASIWKFLESYGDTSHPVELSQKSLHLEVFRKLWGYFTPTIKNSPLLFCQQSWQYYIGGQTHRLTWFRILTLLIALLAFHSWKSGTIMIHFTEMKIKYDSHTDDGAGLSMCSSSGIRWQNIGILDVVC